MEQRTRGARVSSAKPSSPEQSDKNKLYVQATEVNRLHGYLMDFVKRVSQGNATPEETLVLPKVAQTVIELAKYHC